MKNAGLKAVILGAVINFALVVTKLSIGLSSNSLTIYCDAMNNLGDTLACIVALAGFILIKKMGEVQSERAQSLCTFVINLFIAVTGIYFVYNGTERLLYPLPIAYSLRYVIIISATIGVKALMGVMYYAFNRRQQSGVLRALLLDSFLDCFITLAALMSLILVRRVQYAVDGVFAILTGSIITVSAIKGIIKEAKFLVNH